jgi:hypothetical protein
MHVRPHVGSVDVGSVDVGSVDVGSVDVATVAANTNRKESLKKHCIVVGDEDKVAAADCES